MIHTLSDLKRHCESLADHAEISLLLWRKPRRRRIRLFGRFGPVVPVVRRMERQCVVVVDPAKVAAYLRDID